MLWIPLDGWRDENPFGADTPHEQSWQTLPTVTLIVAFAVIFLMGALGAVMGLTIWALW